MTIDATYKWRPAAGSLLASIEGMPYYTTGTPLVRDLDNSGFLSFTPRLGFRVPAVAHQFGGRRDIQYGHTRERGFKTYQRFGFPVALHEDDRLFVGLVNSIDEPSNDDPSLQMNSIGLTKGEEPTLQLFHAGATLPGGLIDLGEGYPTDVPGACYEFYTETMREGIYVLIFRYDVPRISGRLITSHLPDFQIPLARQEWLSNGGAAQATEWDLAQITSDFALPLNR